MFRKLKLYNDYSRLGKSMSLKKHYHVFTQLKKKPLYEAYKQSLFDKLYSKDKFITYNTMVANKDESFKEKWNDELNKAVNRIVNTKLQDDIHPGSRNIVIFIDQDGKEKIIIYGHNNTHSPKTKGADNVQFGSNNDGQNAYVTSQARVTLPLDKVVFDEKHLMTHDYVNSNKAPINATQISYAIIQSSQLKDEILFTDGSTVSIEGVHRETYYNPVDGLSDIVKIDGVDYNVIRVDISDPIVQASIQDQDQLIDAILDSAIFNINKYVD